MVRPLKHDKTVPSSREPPGFIDAEALYTVEELMKRLRMGRKTLRQLRQKGVEIVRFGRRDYIVGSSAIEAFVKTAEDVAKDSTAPRILAPTTIAAADDPPKVIEEFVGRVNSHTTAVSIARMKSPPGWSESGQTPKFNEYTVVLRGKVHVKLTDQEFDVEAGQAIIAKAGEWVQYSTPSPDGAEYIAVCIPAFSPGLVHRDTTTKDGE